MNGEWRDLDAMIRGSLPEFMKVRQSDGRVRIRQVALEACRLIVDR